MAFWTFYDYVNARGQTGMDEWIHTLPKKVRKMVEQEVETRVNHLASVERWDRPDVGQLVDGLIEIRIKFLQLRTQFRPICWYGPGRYEATILTGAIEKDRSFHPPTAVRVAEQRRDLILLDRNRRCIREHVIG